MLAVFDRRPLGMPEMGLRLVLAVLVITAWPPLYLSALVATAALLFWHGRSRPVPA